MTIPNDDVARFHASLERASQSSDFVDAFYDDFFNNATGAQQRFHNTDMERQKRKLKSSLHMLTMLVDETPGAEMYLEHLGNVHGRYQIPPEMFEIFLDSLLYAVGRADPEFDDGLEAVWRRVLRRGIDIMVAHTERK